MRLSFWKKKLKNYGITETKFNKFKKELLKKDSKFKDNDVIWGLLQKIKPTHTSFEDLKAIFFDEALFLNEEGKDCTKQLQEVHKIDILMYKNTGAIGVKILSGECNSCKKLEGKTFSIEKALNENPLPCKLCTYKLKKSNNKSWCRCCYLGVYDEKEISENTLNKQNTINNKSNTFKDIIRKIFNIKD